MDNNDKFKRKFQNALKLSGFNVRREFCNLLLDRFEEQGVDLTNAITFDTYIKKLCGSLETQCLSETSIEREHIDRAIEVCLHSGYDRHETIFSVIDAFDFPKLAYNPDRKLYFLDTNKSKLLPDANTKAKLFLDRYGTVLQRTKRNFQQKVATNDKNQLKLQTVDYLLTLSYITLDRTLILGSLIQAKEGKYFLEDPSGMVELDLTHAKYHGGFFVESSFVLVNGFYEDRILHVSTMVLPPGEEYTQSRPSFASLNYFGGDSTVPLRDSIRLRDHMDQNSNKFMLLFSDVWLDYPMVFEKLRMLFEGVQDVPPIAFVFMGNFMSTSHGSEMMEKLKKLFKQLADLILEYPNISSNSNFVFIPGLADPCMPYMIPRLGLPNYVTADMKRLVPKAIFTTNPCRIQYCTREIVVFRADLVPKLLQGSLHKPAKEEIADCLKRTVISQGHLSPLSLNSLTVNWDFDYCMRIYPLPDMVLIGDKSEAYQGDYKDCKVVNPGSFCDGGFQFKSYTPYSNTVEDCDLEGATED